MTTKDYYKELDRIVRSARPNYWLRIKNRASLWLCKAVLKCFGKHMKESDKTVLEALAKNCKLVPFQTEVGNPLNEVMALISQERNLGNYLVAFTEKSAQTKTLLTNSEIFDILLKFPIVKIQNNLSQLYPDHYQQLVAALDAGDKIHFVRYIDEQRLDTKPLRNLCSCFLMGHRMPDYKGDLSMKEFEQLGAEISSIAQAGEMEVDEDILKLSTVLTDSFQLCNSEITTLLEKYTLNYYYQSLMNYFLYREQLNNLEQQAIETIVKNPRYIQAYDLIYDIYQKQLAEDPGLKERILQKEQDLRLKPAKPREQPSAKAETSNRMPKKPDNITEEQIPLLADELAKAGFINQTDKVKFVYFLRGGSGSYKEPLNIHWDDTYQSLKYLLQFHLYTKLKDGANPAIAGNFNFIPSNGTDTIDKETLRNLAKTTILNEIDEDKQKAIDQIMAKLKQPNAATLETPSNLPTDD